MQPRPTTHALDLWNSPQWRTLVHRWPRPLQQHDAAVFAQFMLEEAGILSPHIFTGKWQARIIEHDLQVTDEGPTWPHLLLLPLVAPSRLSSLFATTGRSLALPGPAARAE